MQKLHEIKSTKPEADQAHPHAHHGSHDAAASMQSGHGTHTPAGGHAHAGMIMEFRRRFWGALGLTLPILWLSPDSRHLVDKPSSDA